ncbi:hypothetical protein [Fervidobacterium thailandense]|uniref:Uncharacterized protein n=1 Tax=Fervidobacterium thailandense TaxID=1008305 RepID=A0A1E3G431_9BACT|nr:hypothetical protein [Fervidobacterium thailandense]ODN30573.1 hypothetical protein A4H02_04855 [Fervidobacterium thailandense]
MRMRNLLSISFLLLVTAGIAFAFLPDSLQKLNVEKNLIGIGAEFYEVESPYYRVFWWQREGDLVGELGYTIDGGYSESFLNYKLRSLKGNFAFNLKSRIIPFDEFNLKLDAGITIPVSKQFAITVDIYDIFLYPAPSEEIELPRFFVRLNLSVLTNVDLKIDITNFGSEVVAVPLGFSLTNFLPQTVLVLQYVPIYKFTDGSFYNAMYSSFEFRPANFVFGLKGFYNISGALSDVKGLMNVWGINAYAGVNF